MLQIGAGGRQVAHVDSATGQLQLFQSRSEGVKHHFHKFGSAQRKLHGMYLL